MKNILLKGVLLAVLLLFLFKGGIKLLLVGWRIYVPILALTVLYFIGRQLVQKKKVKAAPKDPELLIVICPHCSKPKGSCPKCL